ncbi:hypothetical protein [Streptomyces formicae]|uniref:Uncharacterized protein n=1 Tax=Streptomyces formicae TaxID=1616117 RepID=A0ABY3WP46_9ACTN|nr:hypothetical protein [Streptomyces formicae]UNM12350.1 hypothetical protein J4032_13095 [Streptomyces formicae]
MCDRCSAIAAPTISALEALANGEPVPDVPEGVAIPLTVAQIDEDTVVIGTNKIGSALILGLMRMHGLVVPMDGDDG